MNWFCVEGAADDVGRYVDGVLLVDLWEQLVLLAHVRAAWTPLILSILEPGEELWLVQRRER